MIESPPDRYKEADDTPYDGLDAPVVGLCRALNAFPGIWTASSCGGHEGGGQDEEGRYLPAGALPADEWDVTLRPELQGWAPTSEAWLSLEFVAWALRDLGRAAKAVEFSAFALPPFVNTPAHMLTFEIHGWRSGEGGVSPDKVAGFLERVFGSIWEAG